MLSANVAEVKRVVASGGYLSNMVEVQLSKAISEVQNEVLKAAKQVGVSLQVTP